MQNLMLHYRELEVKCRISKMATLLWIEAGKPKNRDAEFWTKAETIVKLQL